MFDQLEEYSSRGHFFFRKGSVLKEVSKEVPEKPGVYCIYALAHGHVELVYIGKSGTMGQNGEFKKQFLNKRLTNKQEVVTRQEFLEQKLIDEDLDGLDIYWYVTYDKKHKDLPAYVEAMLLQRHFEMYGCLPKWNKEF